MILQFIFAFFLASAVMIGGSFLWPIIMKRDRPAILQAVRDKAVETDVGRKAEDVLGAFTIPNDIPQAVSSASSQAATEVGSAVQKRIETIVTTRIIEEVVKRFETLPAQEKEDVKAVICKPSQ